MNLPPALKQKVGPLPVVAWGGILVAMVGGLYLLKRHNAAQGAVSDGQPMDSSFGGMPTGNVGGYGGGGGGSSGPSGGPTLPAPDVPITPIAPPVSVPGGPWPGGGWPGPSTAPAIPAPAVPPIVIPAPPTAPIASPQPIVAPTPFTPPAPIRQPFVPFIPTPPKPPGTPVGALPTEGGTWSVPPPTLPVTQNGFRDEDGLGHMWSSARQTWVDKWGNYQLPNGSWSNNPAA